MVNSMMADDFSTCYNGMLDFQCPINPTIDLLVVITTMKIDRGLALQDLITGAYEYVQEIDLPIQTRVYLLDQLATTEFSQGSLRVGPLLIILVDIGCLLVEARSYS